MLSNLGLVFFFVHTVVKNFKKVLMYHFVIGSIVVYYTIIIPTTLNKIVNYIELRVVKVGQYNLESIGRYCLNAFLFILTYTMCTIYNKVFPYHQDILSQHCKI